MTTHSSSVAWRIPTDSKALQRGKDVTPHAQMQYFFFASVSSVPMGIVHGGGMVSGIMGTLAELTPQSLYSSFPPLCLLGDPHSCLGYIWVLESGLCPCCYLPKCPAGGSQLQKESVPRRTCSHPCVPGLKAGTVIAHQPVPVLRQPTSPPSCFPTSLYPAESPDNNRMGLISWLLPDLWVAGVGRGTMETQA